MTDNAKPENLDHEIAIIGAGFAGIGAGIRLKMQGDHSKGWTDH